MNGWHCILDIFNTEKDINNTHLLNVFVEIAMKNGATIMSTHHHEFSPYGLSLMIILAESHISAHTYPELNSLMIDIFTCSSEAMTRNIGKDILDYLKPENYKMTMVDRGFTTLL